MTITPEQQARHDRTDPTADRVTDVIPVVPAPRAPGAAPWPSALRTREQGGAHRGAVAERPRRRWPWATAGLAVGLLMGVGIGGAALGNAATAAAPAPAPRTVTVTAPAPAPETVTVTAAAPAPVTVTREVPVPAAGSGSSGSSDGLKDGVYQAGADIEAGRYKTSGGGTYGMCLWATYRDAAQSYDAFVDGGSSSGQMYASVAKGQYLELTGGCTWTTVS
ncbi:hypothetical protein GCM10023215_51250 [Pseudonocardia yuanmonensis]|uniref:Uncharacterized protein n=1 Tax=Pseudonocardia yuanmonensis TaxID=1095914 RepID=A0ABP8XD56_9PSEU